MRPAIAKAVVVLETFLCLQACHTHQPVFINNKGVYCGGTMVSGDDFIIGKKLGEGAGGGINYPNSP